jgi:hypothetical protein
MLHHDAISANKSIPLFLSKNKRNNRNYHQSGNFILAYAPSGVKFASNFTDLNVYDDSRISC